MEYPRKKINCFLMKRLTEIAKLKKSLKVFINMLACEYWKVYNSLTESFTAYDEMLSETQI